MESFISIVLLLLTNREHAFKINLMALQMEELILCISSFLFTESYCCQKLLLTLLESVDLGLQLVDLIGRSLVAFD